MRVKSLLNALFFIIGFFIITKTSIAEGNLLKPSHPNEYKVIKGDSLWDIADKFLQKPWMWKKIWYANPKIKNPNLIYPGDLIVLRKVQGKLRVMVSKRELTRTIKLQPKIRRQANSKAIAPISLNLINSIARSSLILNQPSVETTFPRVVGANHNKLIIGPNELVYVLGYFKKINEIYNFYRKEQSFYDKKTDEFLGTLLVDIGVGKVILVSKNKDLATLKVQNTNEEIRLGDLLMLPEEREKPVNFYPKAPEKLINASIIAVIGGVKNIGQYDNVVIDQGQNKGLKEGNLLAIKTENTIENSIKNIKVDMPDKNVGLLLVYRVFDKLSFGVIMESKEPLSVGDKLINP